jgi:hypothetical protein
MDEQERYVDSFNFTWRRFLSLLEAAFLVYEGSVDVADVKRLG